jgi:hypothetical protein
MDPELLRAHKKYEHRRGSLNDSNDRTSFCLAAYAAADHQCYR